MPILICAVIVVLGLGAVVTIAPLKDESPTSPLVATIVVFDLLLIATLLMALGFTD